METERIKNLENDIVRYENDYDEDCGGGSNLESVQLFFLLIRDGVA